ncbi:MAG: MATE family efflux transporter [Tissierellia bacterium]|nr:MATE family efflux transporter [Tissierellia bacterium]
MKKTSLFDDREFIKKVLVVALPMVVQQLLTSSVNLLDNLMVGQLGGFAISAVASTNKYLMVALFGMMGLGAAANIFLAQYHGARNIEKMKESFRYSIVSSMTITLIFVAFGLLATDSIIGFFSDSPELLELARDYLPIAAITMIPQTISYSVQSSMRSVGNTKIPLISSIISLVGNGIFNYILIFGHFGFPALGVTGAALGTLIARVLELAFLLAALKVNDFEFKTKVSRIFSISRNIIYDITKKAIPLFINELGWAGGMAMLFKLYASSSLTALAALPIASTTADLFFVLFSGVAVATIVMVSHPLGSNDIDKARENGYKMLKLSMFAAIFFALAMFGASFITPHLYNISDEVFDLATSFIRTQALFFILYMYNAQIFFVIRAGGDTRSTLLMDSGVMWLINIPVVYLVSTYTDFNPLMVYACGQSTDLIKMAIATYYFKKEKWLVNLTLKKSEV